MGKSIIKCLVVDDEQLARELIAAHLRPLDDFELVATCANAIEASHYLAEHDIDLMFLDIEMPVLKGTDFYQSLARKPDVIFTTAYREYAVDGFELEAVDYLLKPITFARFFKAIERYRDRLKVDTPDNNQPSTAPDHFFIRCDRKAVKVNHQDLLYIKGMKDYLQVHTTHGVYITKTTLKAMLATLPPQCIQVHRSYIINQHHITAYTQHDIELGDTEIPIGESYIKKVKDSLQ